MRDLSLHIMDIIQNSITASASRISTTINLDSDSKINIVISDNGIGMDSEMVCAVTDPFSTTRKTRKVGLGIPLFKASAERSGGSFQLNSCKGKGTIVRASFKADNVDRPPLGEVGETMVTLVASRPDIEFELKLESSKGRFDFNSAQIAEKLGDVPIDSFEVLEWIKSYISEGIISVFGGVLNEISC